MAKTVYVDQDECISCGLCITNVPDVFRFADSGKAEAFDPEGQVKKPFSRKLSMLARYRVFTGSRDKSAQGR